MPLSLYEGALLLYYAGQGPTNHYRFDELSGTTVTDYGVSALNLATNGTVVRGYDSLAPGDPTGHATGQSKDTVLATRGDNATYDRPATTNKMTLLCWYRPDDLRQAGNADIYHLIGKGSSTYLLGVQGSTVFASLSTQAQQLASDVDGLVRPGVSALYGMVFDGTAQTWKLSINGVTLATRTLAAGQTINHAAGGTLQIGGYNAFGNTGIHGRIQHVSVFNAHALTDAQIQLAYQYAVTPAGAEGDECMYVFPWSRQIVAPGGLFDTVQFRNWNPWPVYLSQGGTAVKGAGITLAPRGGTLPKPSTYNGAWSAIVDARYGYGPLAIEKTY